MRRQTRSLAQPSTKWELNAHKPVSRLPAEILSLIFLLVRLAHERENPKLTPAEEQKLRPRKPYSSDSETEDAEEDEIGWIGVSYVCHSWRQIALGSSLLWAHIIIENKRCLWAMEMLKRSKGRLLDIYIDLDVLGKASGCKLTPAAVARSALTNAMKNLDRCKDLFIKVGISNKSMKALHSILEKCFTPSLTSLSIVDCFYGCSRVPKISDNLVKTDSLRTLSLACAEVEWGASFLRNLTTLCLHPLGEDMAFGTLLDGLASMPSLTSLDIDMDDIEISATEITLFKSHPLRERPMQLTHLAIICFESPLPATQLLSFTSKKPIQLYLNVESMTKIGLGDLDDFFDEFSSRISSNGQAITGYHVTHPDKDSLVIQGYHTIKQHVISCGGDQDVVAFNLELSCMFDIFHLKGRSTLLGNAFTKLPTDALQGLVLTGNAPELPYVWDFAFGNPKFTTVEYICISGCWNWTESFFELLQDTGMFPSLIAIGATIAPATPGDVKTEPFSRSLQSRLQNGQKIQHLILHGVLEDERSDFGGLGEFVGKLEFAETLV